MKLTSYLKGLLQYFVDSYQKFSAKTFNVCLTFSIAGFLIAVILFRYTNLKGEQAAQSMNLLHYFFYKQSFPDAYRLLDLVREVFFFVISLFTIGFYRVKDGEALHHTSAGLLKTLTARDIVCLSGGLFVACLADYMLFRLDGHFESTAASRGIYAYIHITVFHIRTYLSPLLFSCTIFYLIEDHLKLSRQQLLYLCLSLWLFNEFASTVFIWLHFHLFSLLLLPFDSYSVKGYLLESFLSIPFLAFCFLGYYAAMTHLITLGGPDNFLEESPPGKEGLEPDI